MNIQNATLRYALVVFVEYVLCKCRYEMDHLEELMMMVMPMEKSGTFLSGGRTLPTWTRMRYVMERHGGARFCPKAMHILSQTTTMVVIDNKSPLTLRTDIDAALGASVHVLWMMALEDHLVTIVVSRRADGQRRVVVCNGGHGMQHVQAQPNEEATFSWPNKALACVPISEWVGVDRARDVLSVVMAARLHNGEVTASDITYPTLGSLAKACVGYRTTLTEVWRWAHAQVSMNCFVRNLMLAVRALLLEDGAGTMEDYYRFANVVRVCASRQLVAEATANTNMVNHPSWRAFVRYMWLALDNIEMRAIPMQKGDEVKAFLQEGVDECRRSLVSTTKPPSAMWSTSTSTFHHDSAEVQWLRHGGRVMKERLKEIITLVNEPLGRGGRIDSEDGPLADATASLPKGHMGALKTAFWMTNAALTVIGMDKKGKLTSIGVVGRLDREEYVLDLDQVKNRYLARILQCVVPGAEGWVKYDSENVHAHHLYFPPFAVGATWMTLLRRNEVGVSDLVLEKLKRMVGRLVSEYDIVAESYLNDYDLVLLKKMTQFQRSTLTKAIPVEDRYMPVAGLLETKMQSVAIDEDEVPMPFDDVPRLLEKELESLTSDDSHHLPSWAISNAVSPHAYRDLGGIIPVDDLDVFDRLYESGALGLPNCIAFFLRKSAAATMFAKPWDTGDEDSVFPLWQEFMRTFSGTSSMYDDGAKERVTTDEFPECHHGLRVMFERYVITYIQHITEAGEPTEDLSVFWIRIGSELLRCILYSRLCIVLTPREGSNTSVDESVHTLETLYISLRDFIAKELVAAVQHAPPYFRQDLIVAPELLPSPLGFNQPTEQTGYLFAHTSITCRDYIPSPRVGVAILALLQTKGKRAFLSGVERCVRELFGVAEDAVVKGVVSVDDESVAAMLDVTVPGVVSVQFALLDLANRHVPEDGPQATQIALGGASGFAGAGASRVVDPITKAVTTWADVHEAGQIETTDMKTMTIVVDSTATPEDVAEDEAIMVPVPCNVASHAGSLEDLFKMRPHRCYHLGDDMLICTWAGDRDGTVQMLARQINSRWVWISNPPSISFKFERGTNTITCEDMEEVWSAVGISTDHIRADEMVQLVEGMPVLRGELKDARTRPRGVSEEHTIVSEAQLVGTDWTILPTTTYHSRVIDIHQGTHILPLPFSLACLVADPSSLLVWWNDTTKTSEAIISEDGTIRIVQTGAGSPTLLHGDEEYDILFSPPEGLHPILRLKHSFDPGLWVRRRGGGDVMFAFSNAKVDPATIKHKSDTTKFMIQAEYGFTSLTTTLLFATLSPEGGFMPLSGEHALQLAKLFLLVGESERAFEVFASSAPPLMQPYPKTPSMHGALRAVESLLMTGHLAWAEPTALPAWIAHTNFISRRRPMNTQLKIPAARSRVPETFARLKSRINLWTMRVSRRPIISSPTLRALHLAASYLRLMFRESDDVARHYIKDIADTTWERGWDAIAAELRSLPEQLMDMLASRDDVGTVDAQVATPHPITKTPLPSMDALLTMIPLMTRGGDRDAPTKALRDATNQMASPQAIREQIARSSHLPVLSRMYVELNRMHIHESGQREHADMLYANDGELEGRDAHMHLVEMERGYFLREDQIEVLHRLCGQFEAERPYIEQILMGKGKSAALMPAMTQAALSKGKKVMVVVPPHLLRDTRHLTGTLASRWLGTRACDSIHEQRLAGEDRPLVITTDVDVKEDWVHSHMGHNVQAHSPNTVALLDEHDMLTNPLTSELNINTGTSKYGDALERALFIRQVLAWVLRPDAESSQTPPSIHTTIQTLLRENSAQPSPHIHVTNTQRCRELLLPALLHAIPESRRDMLTHKLFPLLTQRLGVTFGIDTEKKDDPEAVPFKAKGVPDPESRYEDFDVRCVVSIIPRIVNGLSCEDVGLLLEGVGGMTSQRRTKRVWERLGANSEEWEELASFRTLPPDTKQKWVERVMTCLKENTKAPYYIDLFVQCVLVPKLENVMSKKVVANGTMFCVGNPFSHIVGFTGTPMIYPLYEGTDHRFGKAVLAAQTDEEAERDMREVFSDARISVAVVTNVSTEDDVLLEGIVGRMKRGGRPVRAIIDASACIVKTDPMEVAKRLARGGGGGAEYVGFIDEHSVKRAVEVSTSTIVDLDDLMGGDVCMYFDQANTTGIDVKLRADCDGIILVNGNLTLRDAAQAAYRLRHLGSEETQQHLEVWISSGVSASTNAEVLAMLERNTTRKDAVLGSMARRQFIELAEGEIVVSDAELVRDVPRTEKQRAEALSPGLDEEAMREVVGGIHGVEEGMLGMARQQAQEQAVATEQERETEMESIANIPPYSDADVSGVFVPVHEGHSVPEGMMGDVVLDGIQVEDDEDRHAVLFGMVHGKLTVPSVEQTWDYADMPGDSHHALFDSESLIPIHIGRGWSVEEARDALAEREPEDVMEARRMTGTMLVDGNATSARVDENAISRHIQHLSTVPLDTRLTTAMNMLGMDRTQLLQFRLRSIPHNRFLRTELKEGDIIGLCHLIQQQAPLKDELTRCAMLLGVHDTLKERIDAIEEPEEEMSDPVLEGELSWTDWLSQIHSDSC